MLPDLGDVRVAHPLDGHGPAQSRFVLVLAVDEVHNAVRAAVCTNEIDNATAADTLLVPDETGLAFPLLAQMDLVVSLLGVQFDDAEPSGHISETALQVLLEGVHIPAGLAVRGPSDLRYAWKIEELEVGRLLASEVEGQLHLAAVHVLAPDFLSDPNLDLTSALDELMATFDDLQLPPSELFDEHMVDAVYRSASFEATEVLSTLINDALRDEEPAPSVREKKTVSDPAAIVGHRQLERMARGDDRRGHVVLVDAYPSTAGTPVRELRRSRRRVQVTRRTWSEILA